MPVFYGTDVASRLMLGTAQYPSPAVLAEAFRRSGTGIATVSLRREAGGGQDFWALIQGLGVRVLLCCKEFRAPRLPLAPVVSFDFDCDWHADCGEGVDAPYGYGGFGDLGVAVAGSQVGADDGFVTGHRGFGEGSSVVAGLDFPRLGPDLGDAADGIAPGLWRVLFLGRRGDGSPGFRRNDGPRPDGKDRAVAGEAVIGLVRADHRHLFFDLGQQAGQFGPVMVVAAGQSMGQNLSRFGINRQMQLAPNPPFALAMLARSAGKRGPTPFSGPPHSTHPHQKA